MFGMWQRTKEEKKHNIDFSLTTPFYCTNDRIDPRKIFRRIQKGKRCRSLYLIALSRKDGELLRIYSATELLGSIYEGSEMEICAIGRGKKKTLSLLEQMISDMYQNTNAIDVDLFFNH